MKKINPAYLFKLKELLFIILYWIVMVRIIVLLDFIGLNPSQANIIEPKAFLILRNNLLAGTTAGFAVGLLTGLSELFIFQQYFRNKSFIKLILAKLFVYLICIVLIAILTVFFHQLKTREIALSQAFFGAIGLFTSYGFYHLLMLGAMLSTGINFLLIMKNNLGASIFIPIVLGKYHTPKEENRIFIFIDLKSSTNMAEKLGHVKYSQLVQDCFRDLSDLVVKYRGAIYQFVGDEAVVTWKAKRKNNFLNSILLFFAFRRKLQNKADFYLEKYGVLPRFKAAVNSGKVMAAEVGGNVKSEIAYHGDVLNTAARMMELCKLYEKDLILSEYIVKQLPTDNPGIETSFRGELRLRGKDKKINVYSCAEIDESKVLIG
jgi:adenylate cyclase